MGRHAPDASGSTRPTSDLRRQRSLNVQATVVSLEAAIGQRGDGGRFIGESWALGVRAGTRRYAQLKFPKTRSSYCSFARSFRDSKHHRDLPGSVTEE